MNRRRCFRNSGGHIAVAETVITRFRLALRCIDHAHSSCIEIINLSFKRTRLRIATSLVLVLGISPEFSRRTVKNDTQIDLHHV
jgi:hypothetical protein